MKIKILTDFLMLTAILILMPYALIGEEVHEILGIAMFGLLLIHQIKNLAWYKNLLKGKYNLDRKFSAAINFSILFLILLQIVSGIIISKNLFAFDFEFEPDYFRLIHLAISYWLFIFIAIHFGLHLKILQTQLKIKLPRLPTTIFSVLISIYGIYALINRNFLEYMFLKEKYFFMDFSENLMLFFADYIAIFLTFAFIGYSLKKFIEKVRSDFNVTKKF